MRTGTYEQGELERYRPILLKFALTLTRSLSDAEDLVQRAYERALQAKNQPAEMERRLGWMRVILKNLYIDDGRRSTVRKRVMSQEREGLRDAAKPLGHDKRVQLKLHLRQALQQLPEEMAQAIVLVVVEGFTYAEVAEIQGVAVGTAKSRVARARIALAAVLASGATLTDKDANDG